MIRKKIIILLHFIIFNTILFSQETPDGYKELTGGTRRNGFREYGTYTIFNNPEGAQYTVKIIHKEEGDDSPVLLFLDRMGEILDYSSAVSLKTAAVMENLCPVYSPDPRAELTSRTSLLTEAKEIKEMLTGVRRAIFVHDIGKWVVEYGSRLEGAIVSWIFGGGASQAAGVGVKHGTKVVMNEVSKQVVRQLIEQLKSSDLIIDNPVKLAAFLKAGSLKIAKFYISDAIYSLDQGIKIIEEKVGGWDPDSAEEAYEKLRYGIVYGLSGLQYWNDISGDVDWLGTAKMIGVNFAEGAGMPVGLIFSTQETLDLLIGEGPLAEAIGNFGNHVEKTEEAYFSVYEGYRVYSDIFFENYTSDSGIEMVSVEGDTFQMESFFEEANERAVHTVTVSSFFISKYEVTQGLYRDITGESPSSTAYGNGYNYPVNMVGWNDAIQFCNILSEEEGFEPVYRVNGDNIACDWNKNGYRLPSEAEWLYAARGGNRSMDYEYSGSSNIRDVAWFDGNSSDKLHPVGHKDANELGICDMSGNVWEMCWNLYEGYSKDNSGNTRDTSTDAIRFARSGSFLNDPDTCRPIIREDGEYARHYIDLGIRLVRSGYR